MKLLIVEDNLELRVTLTDYLLGIGHSIEEASDGRIAFNRFCSEPTFHAIISDNSMPNMTGTELNVALQRNFERFPPFIMMSGDMNIETDGLELYALLEKPLMFKILDSYLKDIAEEINAYGGFYHSGAQSNNDSEKLP